MGQRVGRAAWAWAFGLWAAVTLLYSSHLYFFYRLRGGETTWPRQLAEALAGTTVWAAFVPPVLWLAGRAPLGRGRLGRALLVHLPASLLASLLQVAGRAAADAGLVHGTWAPVELADTFRILFARTFHFGVLVYWAIAAARWAAEHYKDQQVRASRLEARLAEARLAALEAQLRPHFLFNTLHSISSLMHRDVAAADRMIARLGELLRLSLSGGKTQEVRLDRELELLEAYLDIERARFGDRLSVETRVTPEARGARVPSLLLQPLVENAVRHGVARRRGAGRIEISAERRGERLELSVRDDGVGLGGAGGGARGQGEGAAGGQGEGNARGQGEGGGNGVGLANTRERLEQLYGGGHRFELRDAPGGGLEVAIAIPFRELGGAADGSTRPSAHR